MSKRLISLLLVAVMALMILPAALAEEETGFGEGYYYVYTENGKTLNVRETPGGRKVGALKYGARIHVDAFVDDNWALILYNYDNGYGKGDYAAFVSRRYLTKKQPPARKPATPTPAPAAVSDPLTELNAEFKSSVKVEPYKVTLRAARASGWISMHWGPSINTEIMATYKTNTQLTVIRETANWLQVEDQNTGDVGFVSKQFAME